MAIDSEDSVSLPVPPPPRPAARRAAIDMALRKFDGIEDAPPARHPERPTPRRFQWASLNRRPAGALVAAAIIAVIGVPAIQIALRDRPPEAATEPAQPGLPAQNQPPAASITANEPPQQAEIGQAVAAAEEAAAPPQPAKDEGRTNLVADRKAAVPALSSLAAPSPMAVIAAPPPPPPPPPAEPQAEASDAAGVGNIVVTGSRIPAPNAKSSGFAQRAEAAPGPREIIAPYGDFLNRLQEALGGNDRRAVLQLVGLPLRVNFAGGVRTYRSRQDIERDYDRIFTPAVRDAAQNLYAGDLTNRDGGRLRGSGRIWFGCGLRTCSSEGVVRVREVTP
jgi:hypothetical protein